MSERDLTIERQLQDIATRARFLLAGAPKARHVLVDAQPGYPPTGSGSDTGGSGGRTITVDGELVPVTSVEAAAILPDKAKGDLRDLDEAVRRACHELTRASAIVTEWSKGTRNGTANAAPNPIDERWCTHHLAKVHKLEPRSDRHADGLCRWCHGFQADVGQLPHHALLDIHDRGGRMTVMLVRRYHPQYARKETWE